MGGLGNRASLGGFRHPRAYAHAGAADSFEASEELRLGIVWSRSDSCFLASVRV